MRVRTVPAADESERAWREPEPARTESQMKELAETVGIRPRRSETRCWLMVGFEPSRGESRAVA